ncbi:relaxase/mobilization nuclease domain-containing protein [Roseibium alexandrii]|uniref:relaxase/mobilization nuclease domain-containing protein n=1 Tax=Roseibium alexandrii TaxID=388408 RepID=UPI003753C5E7
MIIVASQRAGAYALADHLLNDRDNDHVELHDVRGFVADDLRGALTEAYAISKGTQCKQYLFSVSLSPPQEAYVEIEAFENAAKRIEEKFGLTDQPRAIVFHEKEGRRHAHVVWSRIDADSMTAINLPHFKTKLKDLSRELYLDHDWDLPNGLRHDGGQSPLNFTMAEWQQAKRTKLDPREIKQSFRQAWDQSDGVKGFQAALADKGYFLAKGDRRGYVALNIDSEVFSVPRWLGMKTKEVKDRLGDPDQLRSVEETKALLTQKITDRLKDFVSDVDTRHDAAMQPLTRDQLTMRQAHRKERTILKAKQADRWHAEDSARHARLRKGVGGLWDRMTGRTKSVIAKNEREAWSAHKRDQKQREELIIEQLRERQGLQRSIAALRTKHIRDRRILAREINQTLKAQARDPHSYEMTRDHDHHPTRYQGPSLGL